MRHDGCKIRATQLDGQFKSRVLCHFALRGLGGRLLAAAESDAGEQGAQSLTLHVFAVNERARRLYEKAGFEGELMRYIKELPGATGS